MLYDEDGNAYVEPPLLPREKHVFNVVKDYRRMYLEYGRIVKANERLRMSNNGLGKANVWLRSEVTEAQQVIRHCVNHMRKNGLEPSEFLTGWMARKFIK